MSDDSNTELVVIDKQDDDSQNETWLRISAFLSMKSENTQKTYLGIINEWCDFLGIEPGSPAAAKRISGATEIDALAYINTIKKNIGQKPRVKATNRESKSKAQTKALSKERSKKQTRNDGTQSQLANATLVKKVAALRRIYRVLISAGIGPRLNPFASDSISLPSPKSGQKRPTEMISYKKVSEVLTLPNRTTLKGRRDAAILALLFGGGLRRSEVIKLRIADVKRTSANTLYVYLRATKAGADAEQALPAWAAPEIDAVITDRKEQGAKDGDFLICSFRGQAGVAPTHYPVSATGLYNKTYCSHAGIDKIVSPHSARATSITKLLDQGMTHREVQEFSRHASVQMVEVYDKRRYGVDESPAKDLSY